MRLKYLQETKRTIQSSISSFLQYIIVMTAEDSIILWKQRKHFFLPKTNPLHSSPGPPKISTLRERDETFSTNWEKH